MSVQDGPDQLETRVIQDWKAAAVYQAGVVEGDGEDIGADLVQLALTALQEHPGSLDQLEAVDLTGGEESAVLEVVLEA